MTAGADAVVIGAGIVGAACARELALAGLRVVVFERGSIAAGSSGRGEGNLLVSDKLPGPELELARLSLGLWRRLGESLEHDFELERKGGLVVAADQSTVGSLHELCARQAEAGVALRLLAAGELAELEPELAPRAGGALYPEDLQLQPIRATAALLADARRRGAEVLPGTPVERIELDPHGAVAAVRGGGERISTAVVVNAAGVWSAAVAELAGSRLDVRPRRGHVLVTEPLPPLIAHKVYAADYVENVVNREGGIQVSTVIEGTAAGPVLIGSSRELTGFDERPQVGVWRRIAAAALEHFPALSKARILRAYHGFRPLSPDGLPLIGPDPWVPGLWQASGHEGAGIGLAPATAVLIAAGVTGNAAPLDPTPFAPGRLAAAGGGE